MTFLLVFIGWLFSLCLHEYAHARVAYAGGDTSVREKGYLSFNPLRYTDPMLSIVMPLLFLVMGGLGLPGGAVYIEHWRLRSKHWDSAVSAAGIVANFLFALLLIAILHFAPATGGGVWPGLAFLALLEISAVVLNLIPVPPLDGYGILKPYLPPYLQRTMNEAGRWSMWALFLVLWYVRPVADAFWGLVDGLASMLGVPMDLAAMGYQAFTFWRR